MDKRGDRQNTVAAVAGCCELYDLQYGGAGNMNGVWQKKNIYLLPGKYFG